ncbi:hypothetical protein JCM10213_004858 [Rhodosporidiobolus nylandii]
MSQKERMKPRKDKSEIAQKGRLDERRQARENEERDAEIARLTRERDDALTRLAAQTSGGGGGGGWKQKGGANADVKAIQKDVGDLQKKLRRLEGERDSAIGERDGFAAKFKEAQQALDSDSRLKETTAALSEAQGKVSSLQARLKSVQEESEVFSTRLQQLERGAASQADIKRDKEKREFSEKMTKMEEKAHRLEDDKVHLAAQLKTARAKANQLEELKETLERENARMRDEVRNAESLGARAEPNGGGTTPTVPTGGCSAVEKKRLTDKISQLEKQVATNARRADEAEKGSTGGLGGHSRRYHDLLDNLRLSEDDVSTLLREGQFWPPVRYHHQDSSLIDLLWLLDDEQTEADDDKKAWQAKVAQLEQDLRRQKRRAEDAEERAAKAAFRAHTPPDSRSNSRTRAAPNGTGSTRSSEEDREKERLRETIVELEARLAAFERNAGIGRPASRASSGFAPTSVSTGTAQALVGRLSKTIGDLNDEIAELRDENTALLLKLVGVE